MRRATSTTKESNVSVGLHQGLTLSSFLFTLLDRGNMKMKRKRSEGTVKLRPYDSTEIVKKTNASLVQEYECLEKKVRKRMQV